MYKLSVTSGEWVVLKPNKKIFMGFQVFAILVLHTATIMAAQDTINRVETFESFIQRVLKSHESLELAKLNIIRTKSEIQVIESSLGWNLFANAGVNRNRSFVGAEVNQSLATLGVNKIFQSGNSIELKGDYLRDDSEFALSPLQANPLTTSSVAVDYRMPLMQNKNFTQYQLDINSVNSNYTGSINTQSIIRDEITSQAIELYYGAAILVARLDTAKKSIQRSKKLRDHIQKNIKLGILEKGEISQAEAQIYNLQGQYEELVLVWDKSKIAINRLIGVAWNNSFNTVISNTPVVNYNLVDVNEKVIFYNPELKTLNLDLKVADSIIAFHQDNTKSRLDLVFSVGGLNTQGPSLSGAIDESDVIGGIRVEYQKALDNRGLDSKLYQSQVDKNTIEVQIKKLEQDLKYDTNTLISNINQLSKINNSYRKRHKSEIEKYKDIVNRYRAGRADTNLVIQFENELTQAELVFKTQKILREKIIALLKLKQGILLDTKNN
ncbi:MAG: TolC family protein [Gammaproteobacteria bacterium]